MVDLADLYCKFDVSKFKIEFRGIKLGSIRIFVVFGLLESGVWVDEIHISWVMFIYLGSMHPNLYQVEFYFSGVIKLLVG